MSADLEARRARNAALVARPSSSGKVRVLVSVGGGLVAAVAVSLASEMRFGVPAGLIVAAAAYVVWTYLALRGFDGHATKLHSHREDTGGALSDVGAVAVVVANLVVAATLVLERNGKTPTTDALLAVGSVMLSWFLLHTFYVARYAQLYYADDSADDAGVELVDLAGATVKVGGGIDFNRDGYWPRYSDFTYFAFNLGMTYQVSDTSVSSPRIRTLVLHHCLLSYFFATAITATVINLVIGLVA